MVSRLCFVQLQGVDRCVCKYSRTILLLEREAQSLSYMISLIFVNSSL